MNKRFFVVIGLSALLLFGCSRSDKLLSEQEYLAHAKDALDQGRYNEAVIQLKNVINVNSGSREGRYLLGELYVNMGSGAAAEKELRRAAELGVADEAIVPLMGDALLLQGKADEVINNYQVKQADSAQVKLSSSIVVAEAYFQKRDFAAAKEWFTTAQSLSAENERATLGLARIAILERDYDRAQTLINSVISGVGKQSQKAWLTLVDLKRAQNSPEEIIAAYKQAIELSKNKQDYFYRIAMRGLIIEYLQQNNLEKAEVELGLLKKSYNAEQFPDDPELNQIRATLAYGQKKYDVAADLAGKVLMVNENHLGATLMMGAISTIKGQSEQAEAYLRKLPNNIMARKLLAYVQMSRGHATDVIDTLTPIVKGGQPDPEILALIAGASLRAGNPNKSAEYYQQALDDDAGNSNLRLGLAQSYIGMEEFDRAVSELNKVKGEDGQFFAAELAIAEARIKEKKYPAALESLKALEQSDKANPLPISLQATVYSLMGDDAKAKAEFQRALKMKPGYPPAARSLALFELRTGNLMAAKKYYDAVLKEFPMDLATHYDYALVEMDDGQYKHADELLKKAQNLDKSKIKGAVLLARLALKQNDPTTALAVLREAGDIKNPFILAEMGNSRMMMKEYVNAKDSYKKLTEMEANSAQAYYLLSTAQLALNETKEASSSLKTSLQKDGKYVPSLIASVSIALNDNALSAAREKLTKLEKITPNTNAVMMLKANLAMREKRFAEAITLYSDLYKRTPDAALAQKLAQAYWSNGDKKTALTVLSDAAKKQPTNSQMQFALATAYQEIGDVENAVESYKQAIRLDGKNPLALNNLAWLLKDSDPVKAKEYAEKASQLAPDNVAIQDTLVEVTKRQVR